MDLSWQTRLRGRRNSSQNSSCPASPSGFSQVPADNSCTRGEFLLFRLVTLPLLGGSQYLYINILALLIRSRGHHHFQTAFSMLPVLKSPLFCLCTKNLREKFDSFLWTFSITVLTRALKSQSSLSLHPRTRHLVLCHRKALRRRTPHRFT